MGRILSKITSRQEISISEFDCDSLWIIADII